VNTIIYERKLNFIEIISEGSKILFLKIKDISLIALIAVLPASLLPLLGLEEFQFQGIEKNPLVIVLVILLFLLQGIFSLIASMSIAVIVEKVATKEDVSAIEAIKHALSKLGNGIATSLYLLIIVFGLTLLLVIPGIIYSNYYIFVLYVVALRNKSGGEALDYSKMLVEGQWWRVFGILLGAALIFGIIETVISLPLGLISNSPYIAIITNAVTLFSNAIFTVMPVVLFLNNDFSYHHRLAKRKEMEISRKTKKAPSIEEYAKDTKATRTTAKRSSVKKVTVKSEKPKAVAKRSTRKKE
jgi:hypothetical protein